MVKRVITIEFTEKWSDGDNIEHNSNVKGTDRLTLRQMDNLINTLQHVRYIHAQATKQAEALLDTQA